MKSKRLKHRPRFVRETAATRQARKKKEAAFVKAVAKMKPPILASEARTLFRVFSPLIEDRDVLTTAQNLLRAPQKTQTMVLRMLTMLNAATAALIQAVADQSAGTLLSMAMKTRRVYVARRASRKTSKLIREGRKWLK